MYYGVHHLLAVAILQSQLQEVKEELNGKAQLLGMRDAELKLLDEKLIASESLVKSKGDDWTALEEKYKEVGHCLFISVIIVVTVGCCSDCRICVCLVN